MGRLIDCRVGNGEYRPRLHATIASTVIFFEFYFISFENLFRCDPGGGGVGGWCSDEHQISLRNLVIGVIELRYETTIGK